MAGSWFVRVVAILSLVSLGGCSSGDGGTGGATGGAGGGTGGVAGAGGTGGVAGCTPGGCGSTEYCALAGTGGSSGDCRGSGVCEPRPEACTRDFIPVCGCDGVTYDNACIAAAAGASVDFSGRCPCFSNDTCLQAEYCVRSPACQAGPGTCQPRPDSCSELFDPVCGCDGQTYDSECFANASGTVVSADQPCDCVLNDDCDAAQYCDAQTCDGPGYCTARPLDCPTEEDTVATCDGVLWRNACVAAQNGVRVRDPAP